MAKLEFGDFEVGDKVTWSQTYASSSMAARYGKNGIFEVQEVKFVPELKCSCGKGDLPPTIHRQGCPVSDYGYVGHRQWVTIGLPNRGVDGKGWGHAQFSGAAFQKVAKVKIPKERTLAKTNA